MFDPATVASGNYAFSVNSNLDGYYEITDGSFLMKASGFDSAFGTAAVLVINSAVNGFASGTISVGNNSPRQLSNIYVTRVPAVTTPIAQSITFPAIGGNDSALFVFGATFTLGATASSGLPVTYVSQSASVCTVIGNTVTRLSVGNCIIVASQAGNATFAAAPSITKTIAIKASIDYLATVSRVATNYYQTTDLLGVFKTVACTEMVTADNITLRLNTFTTGTLIFSSGRQCQLVNRFIPATFNIGSYLYSTTSNGDGFYESVEGNRLFRATGNDTASGFGALTTITTTSAVNQNTGSVTGTLAFGNSLPQLARTLTNIYWTAGNDAPPPLAQTISFPQLSRTVTFTGQSAFNLDAVSTSNLPISYTSRSTGICTVSGSTVTMLALGTCIMTASQAGSQGFLPAFDVNQNITLVAPALTAQTITFLPVFGNDSVLFLTQGSFFLSATASSGLPVTYASQSAGVCTVAGSIVTMLGVGNCVMVASQAGNTTFAAAPSVTKTIAIKATIDMADIVSRVAANYYQTSSSSAVFKTAACAEIVTADSITLRRSGLTTGTLIFSSGRQCQVVNIFVPATYTIGSYRYSTVTTGDGFYESVEGSRLFRATGNDTASGFGALTTITTTSAVNQNTGSVTGTLAFGNSLPQLARTLTNIYWTAGNDAPPPLAQTISFPQLSRSVIFTGQSTFNLDAVSTSNLPISYTSRSTGICTVSGSTVTMAAPGTCIIAASQAGSQGFLPAFDVNQDITLVPATPIAQTITFAVQTPQSLPFSLGGTFALNPVASASSGLAVSYQSTTLSVCTISGTTVSILAVGTCTISAMQAGNAVFAPAATVTQSITIGAAGRLALALVVSPLNAKPGTAAGSDLIYTLTVTNATTAVAGESALAVTLPANAPLVWSTAGCTTTATAVNCAIPAMAVGATVVRNVVVRPATAGEFALRATVTTTGDPVSPIASANTSVFAAAAAVQVPRYRLYQAANRSHYFTTDLAEYNALKVDTAKWSDDKETMRVFDNPVVFDNQKAVPYYKIDIPSQTRSIWTSEANEYYTLTTIPGGPFVGRGADGWVFQQPVTGSVSFFRIYFDAINRHLWTTDTNEVNHWVNVVKAYILDGSFGYPAGVTAYIFPPKP